MENLKQYKSHDFYTSCVILASKKLKLIGLERNKNNLVTFVFDDPLLLASQIIQKHWNRENKIPSRDLIEAINELKTRIYSGI